MSLLFIVLPISHGQRRKALIFTRDVETFVGKIADTRSEAELTGKSGDAATVCLLAKYLDNTDRARRII